MSRYRIPRRAKWLVVVCSLAGSFHVKAVSAQQVPTYRMLDSVADAPQKLSTEPHMLSRFPTTFSLVSLADGNDLRTVDINGRVWQWSNRRSQERTLVAELDCELACAVLSDDGRLLAYADATGGVFILDLATEQIDFRDTTKAERTVTLTFSPDGKALAGVSEGGEARVWDVGSSERILEFQVDAGAVQSVAFSPDGQQLAIASFSRKVRLYGVYQHSNSGLSPDSRVIDTSARVTALAFTPNGNQLVIATSDGLTKVLDLAAVRPPIELGSHAFATWTIEFEPNGQRMASGSWDGMIKLWDVRTWELLQSVKAHEGSVSAMRFDGRRGLISAGLDGRLLDWQSDVPGIRSSGMIAGRPDSVWIAAYSPDGKKLFVGGRERRFELWDARTHKLLVARAGHPTTRCAAFSPDGTILATGGDDGKIFLCDAETGQMHRTLERHLGAVSAVVFTNDGRSLVSVCDGGFVKTWNVATGEEQASWKEHQQQIYCAAISPDGKWLVTGGGNWTTGDPGELLVWELASGRVRARVEGHKLAVWTIVFTPDGKRFLSSDSSGAVKVWNSQTLDEERTLQHSTWVRPLALSPDGSILAVGRGDGSIRLWDTATWTETASCEGHERFTFWLQFAPGGKILTSGGEDGTVRFWDVAR